MPRLRMKQQFAIGAKNPGAATTVVRLALRWGGTNQSGPVCAQIKVSIRSLFSLSSTSQGGGPCLGPGPHLGLEATRSIADAQHTTHNTEYTSSLTHGRPGTDPSCHQGRHLDAILVMA